MADEGGGSALTSGAPSAAPVTNGAANGDSGGGDWRSGFPDEFKTDATLSRFASPLDLAKSHVELRKAYGGALPLPKPDAAPEEWEKAFSKLRPESPDKYEFNRAEGAPWDENAEKWFRGTAHKIGIHQRQAAPLLEAFNTYQGDQVAAFEKEMQDGLAALRVEWGSDFERRVNAARMAVERKGGDELKKVLDDYGLGNHPVFIKHFAAIGESMREDTGTGNVGIAGSSKELIQQKINAILNDPKHPFNDRMATHEAHKKAVAEYHDLNDQMHRAR